MLGKLYNYIWYFKTIFFILEIEFSLLSVILAYLLQYGIAIFDKRQAISYHPFCRPELQALYSQSHCFPHMLPHPFISPFHVQPHMHASAASYWINCLIATSTCSLFIDHQIHCLFVVFWFFIFSFFAIIVHFQHSFLIDCVHLLYTFISLFLHCIFGFVHCIFGFVN